MMVDYRIAPTADEHVEELQAAIDAVARERRYLAAVSGFPLEQTRQFVASVAAGGGVQHVALDDGSVVGWCDIQRNPFEGFRHVGVLGIGLLPGYRGSGTGAALLERTLAAGAGAGIRRVELEVFASNSRARQLFERAGFVTEGIKRRARVLDGREDDVVCMARLT